MDCLEGLKLLDDNSIDSIVTDPPYEIGYKNNKWDKTKITYNELLWQECFRVLKPGSHMFVFNNSKTFHRVACIIENINFELRDTFQWLYSSGMAKNLNAGRAIEATILTGGSSPTQLAIAREMTNQSVPLEKNYGMKKSYDNNTRQGITKNKPNTKWTLSTKEGKKWDGWGNSLKPSYEPILLFRKPFSEKTMAENILKWGVGALNILNCKINNRYPTNIIMDENIEKYLNEIYSNFIKCFYCAKASKKERGEGNSHPTVKPLSLIKYLITLVTPPEGICLDPFEGSGTHIIACKELGFNYIGFEKEKEYCEIIKQRVNKLVK